MTIDLDFIARRSRCDLSSLRIALPLLEQGYEPPFLTRYRRDELGSVSERALWDVASALRNERQLDSRRQELRGKYAVAGLDDTALLASIDQAQTPRQLDRIARRIRNESGQTTPSSQLAVRLLNPKANDPVELAELAELVVGADNVTPAVEGLDSVLGQYLAADSRMVQAATTWMDRHVQLHVIDVNDPHEGASDPVGETDDSEVVDESASNTAPKSASRADASSSVALPTEHPTESGEPAPPPESTTAEPAPPTESTTAESTVSDAEPSTDQTAETTAGGEEMPAGFSDKPASASKQAAKKAKGTSDKKKPESTRKKISPRQRRRKWLVGVLLPLKGKSLTKSKLTAFQVVMLGRALRSQVVQCAFKYNAGELVNHLAKTAAGLNEGASNELSQVVIDNEAAIREALESAWWDDLIDRAARRLVSVAADSLRRQMHREPIDAKNVLVIDAVGPRTSALVIVGPNDKVLHTEDIACQLSKTVRQQLVARLGELVHQYHVDLIVVSNGPARRGCMVALSELLSQSRAGSLRWTMAERAGAEVYAGGAEGNRELKSIPRRFRAGVWLCQSVRSPARALAKVDVSKLRLGSYQRELAEAPLVGALNDIVTSGVCQISVDANAADRGWLASLPGVNESIAESMDVHRRVNLFKSRAEILALDVWPDLVSQRQAAGFLRVYDGASPLDATAIHPDDYALAEKLMVRLEIPTPPAVPVGYAVPDYTVEEVKVATPASEATGSTFTEVKIVADPDRPFGELGEAESSSSVATIEADVATAEMDTTDEATEPEAIQPELDQPAMDEAGVPAGDVTEAETENSAEASDANSESESPVEANDAAVETQVAESTETTNYRHPVPDSGAVSRCVKEWQVGESRVRQIVRSLCEPFSDSTGDVFEPVAAMTTVPKLSELKPGDLVAGVVVGVAGFGVFVELGPECSGLIHVSRLSEDYVEDLNEFLQIGDVITAWVIEIDTKRRRVALSGISPAKQAAASQERADRQQRGGGSFAGARSGQGEQRRGGQSHSTGSTGSVGDEKSSGNRGGRGEGKAGSQSGGNSKSGGQGDRQAGGGRSSGQSGSSTSRDNRGGRGSDRGTGGGQGRGGKPGSKRDAGSRGPTTYTTVSRSDAPKAKISDAMKTGSEPLRSFGDLMQFFKGSKEDQPAPELQTVKPKDADTVPDSIAGTADESVQTVHSEPTKVESARIDSAQTGLASAAAAETPKGDAVSTSVHADGASEHAANDSENSP